VHHKWQNGAMKRSDLTGSVASVAAKDIEGFQTSSVAGALGGQIAGVQITSTDGTPGAGFNINIRGVGSLTGDSSPLYIVDGFQVDDIDYFDSSCRGAFSLYSCSNKRCVCFVYNNTF